METHTSVHKVGTLHCGHRVGKKAHLRTGAAGQHHHVCHQGRRWLQIWRAGDAHIHAHLHPAHQQRAAHVETRIAQVAKRQRMQRAVGELFHGHQVGQHLGRVRLVGQAVPHRNLRMGGQLLHHALVKAPVLDAIEHASQHPRGVLERLLVAHLRTHWVDVGHMATLVVHRHLKSAAGAGGSFLKNQRNVAALKLLALGALRLGRFEFHRQIDQVADLGGAKVLQVQQAAVVQVGAHSGSRSMGQLMQWLPPRPRPSSLLGRVMTSTPALRSKVLVYTLRS
jgi:hypothetical protein